MDNAVRAVEKERLRRQTDRKTDGMREGWREKKGEREESEREKQKSTLACLALAINDKPWHFSQQRLL